MVDGVLSKRSHSSHIRELYWDRYLYPSWPFCRSCWSV